MPGSYDKMRVWELPLELPVLTMLAKNSINQYQTNKREIPIMSIVVPNLSVTYLKSAARFAKNSYKIEMENQEFYENPNLDWENLEVNNTVCELIEEDSRYAIASVIHAWMFIESYINEILCRSEFDYKRQISSRFAIFWQVCIQEPNQSTGSKIIKNISKAETLDKYQRVLKGFDKPLFVKGNEPYQSINNLRELRNAMVHYNPEEWGDDIETSKKPFSEKLEKSGLKSKIKTLNPFIEKTDNPFFPDKCFGYGCAKWAVQSSVRFIEEFSIRMELQVFDEWFEEANNLP